MILTHYSKLLAYLAEPNTLPCPPAKILRDQKMVKQNSDGRWQATAKGLKVAA